MAEPASYENYPLPIVLLSTLFSASIYAIGAYIMSGFGILFSVVYLLYCLWIELRVLKMSCINCHYYGKSCAFGKGRLCSLLFKKGSSKKFVETEISWLQVLPDLMVSIIPLAGGVILLLRGFSWLILTLLTILAILSSAGNAIIRGSFACKHCKQKELGCPAEKLFNKKKNT